MMKRFIKMIFICAAPSIAAADDQTAIEQEQTWFATCKNEPDHLRTEICFGFKIGMNYCRRNGGCGYYFPTGFAYMNGRSSDNTNRSVESIRALIRAADTGQLLDLSNSIEIGSGAYITPREADAQWILIPPETFTGALGQPIPFEYNTDTNQLVPWVVPIE